jgi:hypothetical protein
MKIQLFLVPFIFCFLIDNGSVFAQNNAPVTNEPQDCNCNGNQTCLMLCGRPTEPGGLRIGSGTGNGGEGFQDMVKGFNSIISKQMQQ